MSNVKKDPTRINRDEHDPKANAKRVKLIDAQFNMELDHLDGDSVTSHHPKMVVSSIGVDTSDEEVVPPMDCSSIKRLKMYVEVVSGMKDCSLHLQVSPVDKGDVWFNLEMLMGSNSQCDIKDVCARRVRVIQKNPQGKYELNVHLVGQG